MVEALGMSDDLATYFHEDEGEEKIVGGDKKFWMKDLREVSVS